MYSADWLIDFAFDYPVDCTPAKLVERLEYFATDWPGWDNFPWRLTRIIHKFLDHPPVNFLYLMLHRCLQGYAAHLVLNSRFESRPEVLAVMIREKCEIVGLLRLLLLDAVRYELRFTDQERMPDCSGPRDGHERVSPEELMKRRAAFQECIEGAVKEFVRILALMSVEANMNAIIYGRPLRYWARGGDMPEPVTLPVLVEVTAAGKVLIPCQAERSDYVRSGYTRAEVVVERKKAEIRGQKSESTGQRAEVSGKNIEVTDGADRADGRGSVESGRVRAKRAAAGRVHAVIKEPRDRKAIRAEVRRLVKMGLSQTEACRQVAEQAQKGRAGVHALTMKYALAPCEATPSVVRRLVIKRL
ncbi:MAG: hypothetical protein ACOYOU_18555 [Kiritimatiellia bacterium]